MAGGCIIVGTVNRSATVRQTDYAKNEKQKYDVIKESRDLVTNKGSRSSTGQSAGLLIRGLQVRVLPGV